MPKGTDQSGTYILHHKSLEYDASDDADVGNIGGHSTSFLQNGKGCCNSVHHNTTCLSDRLRWDRIGASTRSWGRGIDED